MLHICKIEKYVHKYIDEGQNVKSDNNRLMTAQRVDRRRPVSQPDESGYSRIYPDINGLCVSHDRTPLSQIRTSKVDYAHEYTYLSSCFI